MKNRVCFPGSLYVFTFYLLMSSKEEILSTTYFFDKNIKKYLREKMPHTYYIDDTKWYTQNKWIHSLYSILMNRIKYPELFNSDIYGLDFRWNLLRGHKVNYIEDGPLVFDIWETGPMYEEYVRFRDSKSLKDNIKKCVFGDYFGYPVATSNMVTDIYTTASVEKTYVEGKKKHVVDLAKAWRDSPQDKKDLILSIFDISNELLSKMQTKKIILLTQAFSDDKFVTDDEQIEIYRKILLNYDENDVIIKPHPRDNIDYVNSFHNVMLFDKAITMQFLAILGVTFERVVTVSSSSALSFGLDLPVDWYGYKVHPGILRGEGIRTLEAAIENYQRAHGQK